MTLELNDARPGSKWFALRVRAKHEKRAVELMSVAGFSSFLPLQHVRRRWSQRWKELDLPLFPGYVFSRFGREDWSRIINLPGVVDAVRFGEKLAPVDEDELQALRLAEKARYGLEPCAYFPAGQRIRIVDGPLAGLIGTVARDQGRAELILSVTLLQRSVRLTIERDLLELALAAA